MSDSRDNSETVRELRNQIDTLRYSISCLQQLIARLEYKSDEEETITAESVATEPLPVPKVERVIPRRATPKRATPKKSRRHSIPEATPQPRSRPTFLGVYDSEGQEIHAGDTVEFLSGGKYTSRTGIAYRVADNLERVTARDRQNRCISRAPENLKVIKFSTSRV